MPRQLSVCGGGSDDERARCLFFFPSVSFDARCIYFREDLDGHCDNAAAQHHARNYGKDGKKIVE